MHAVIVTEYGEPDVLQWQEVPDPTPGPGEVLVDICASAVNRADLLQRQGFYPPPPGAPEWPGLECSGRIASLGEGVVSRSVGEEVCCLLAGGGYAEQVAVPVAQTMPIPAGVDLVTAAGLPEVACTVWSNLVMVAGLQRGEWVLIHGGGSGIGTMAIQVARALGARVAVTAGSADKLARCEELGAEVLIDYRKQDFVEVIAAETGSRGVDVILDNMGAKYLMRNVDCLAPSGRLVVIGMQGGVRAEVDLGVMLRRNLTLHTTSLRARSPEQKAYICAETERMIWPWISAGIVRPVVDRTYEMVDAADAHRALEGGGITGKILLTR